MRVGRRQAQERRVLDLDGTATDAAIVKAVMYYPEDAKTRSHYLQWHRLLHSSAGAPEHLDLGRSVDQEHLAKITRHATTAGAVLACYHLLDRMKDAGGVFAKPSIEKAMHAVEGLAHEAHTFSDQSVIRASAKTLKSCWKGYRSSAPFWAAMWLNDRGSPYAFMEPNSQFNDPAHLSHFLGVAKGLRIFGTSTFTIQRRPLLDDASTWSVPETIVARMLPDTAPRSDRLFAIMHSYEPRRSVYESSRVVK